MTSCVLPHFSMLYHSRAFGFLRLAARLYVFFVSFMLTFVLLAVAFPLATGGNFVTDLRSLVAYLATLSVTDYQGFVTGMHTLLAQMLVPAVVGALICEFQPQIQHVKNRTGAYFAESKRLQRLAYQGSVLMLAVFGMAIIYGAVRLINTTNSANGHAIMPPPMPNESRVALVMPDMTVVAGVATIKQGSAPGEYVVQIKSGE